MKTEALDFPNIIPQEKNESSPKFSYLLAFAGICGGISAIFIGFIFIIIHAAMKGDTVLDEIGTILMMVAIPMLFVGGHFMDKANEKKK